MPKPATVVWGMVVALAMAVVAMTTVAAAKATIVEEEAAAKVTVTVGMAVQKAVDCRVDSVMEASAAEESRVAVDEVVAMVPNATAVLEVVIVWSSEHLTRIEHLWTCLLGVVVHRKLRKSR